MRKSLFAILIVLTIGLMGFQFFSVWKINSDGNLEPISGRKVIGKVHVVEKSADAVTLTVAEVSNTIITTQGWDGAHDQVFTLPDADTSVGANLKFILMAAETDDTQDLYIDPEGSTTQIYLDGAAVGDGERIWLDNPTVGEAVECYTATQDGTTYDWFCTDTIGGWGDKGS